MLRMIMLVSCFLLSSTAFADLVAKRLRLVAWKKPHKRMSLIYQALSPEEKQTIFYGKVDFGRDVARYPLRLERTKTWDFKDMNHQVFRFRDLEPNTKYYFVIKSSSKISERYWFRTLPDDPSIRLSLVAGGDSRNNRDPRREANKMVSILRPHAVLFGGDFTSFGWAGQWQDWLDDWQATMPTDKQLIPIIPARGNHEYSGGNVSAIFDVPENEYFSTGLGGDLVRVWTLNTEISIAGDQTEWLKRDLQTHASNYRWNLAQYHKPMRPHVQKKKEGEMQYRYWAPLFYQHQMDLVIESDSHTVKTTEAIRPEPSAVAGEGFVRDDQRGTVYIGEGCWGAPLRGSDDRKIWTRAMGSFNQFKLIFVDQYSIEIRTIPVSTQPVLSEVDPDNLFELPEKLKLWNPRNGSGDVVTIYQREIKAGPKVGKVKRKPAI